MNRPIYPRRAIFVGGGPPRFSDQRRLGQLVNGAARRGSLKPGPNQQQCRSNIVECYDVVVFFAQLLFVIVNEISLIAPICCLYYNCQLNGCIVWNAHNAVFGCKWSAICAQAVYFLHSTMPSVTCLRLSVFNSF